ncbi:P-loop nucleoside triphosphate hydrolase superfamily protein with CH (Calponin-like proteiny) domain [Abeliophyllum distichum]|uniref:P-loop nucleoside triphosphate hydrolase superfamily protein with CH (Calponin-like proteiny) domain n=1 Tax=Abeliophyllum distichum TaxID=126358 RepID=A0ABD1TVI2_9LAMI
MDEIRHHKEFFQQSRLAVVGGSQNFTDDIGSMQYITEGIKNPNEDVELLGFGDADSEERLSDISDSVLSMGTETDSINSIVEYTLFPETAKPPVESIVRLDMPTKLPRPPQKQIQAGSSRLSLSKSSSQIPSSKKTVVSSSSAVKGSKRWV